MSDDPRFSITIFVDSAQLVNTNDGPLVVAAATREALEKLRWDSDEIRFAIDDATLGQEMVRLSAFLRSTALERASKSNPKLPRTIVKATLRSVTRPGTRGWANRILKVE